MSAAFVLLAGPLAAPGLGVAFAAPWGLALGAGAAAALAALHAITVGRPRPAPLPTARFAPDRPPRAARRLRRPRDLAVLLLRMTAALAAGAALAGPVRVPERRAVRRVVLADVSRAAAAPAARAAVRAGVLAAARPGDVVIAFAERPAAPAALGDAGDAGRRLDAALATPGSLGAGAGPGSLSAALVAARRTAPALAAAADSLELLVVSPLLAEEADAATARVRAAWAGRARVVRVPGPPAARRAPAPVALRGGPPDDALAAAVALAGRAAGPGSAPAPNDTTGAVRVVRAGGLTADDRAWAAGAPGRVLVDWPSDGAPDGARPLAPPDTAQALAAVGAGAAPAAAVAPFARRAVLGGSAGRDSGRVVARWADGRPAADERPAGAGGGCVRRVAVAVPQAGDAALRAGFRAVLGALLGPCGGAPDPTPLGGPAVAALAGGGPLLAAAPLRAALAPPRPDRLGAALLAVALLALGGEWLVRRRARGAAPGEGVDAAEALPAGAEVGAPDGAARRPRAA